VKKIRQKTVETGRENFCALHDAQHQVITMKVEMRSLLRQRNAAGRPTHFSRKKESEGAHASCLQRLRKEKPKRKGKKRKKERKKERASPICCALSKTTIFCFRDGRSPSRIRAASIVFFPCVRRQALRFLADDKNQIMPVA